MIQQFLSYIGNSALFTGIASVAGIISLLLTIIVTFRTKKISKILKYNSLTEQYNKERTAFQKSFEGHRSSILEDNIKSPKLLNDILKQVEEYRVKFRDILTFKEKVALWRFSMLLQKDIYNVDWTAICNHLAKLSGRLAKKEEIRNG